MSTTGHQTKPPIRCAIYTRKSTSEGLEQEFSSLDAQREAGQSYIASQKGEGWVPLPDQYDDGGFTGANLDRPALQQLLADIRDGRIDCVVVYKVDRLSRSLLDFTRLLELFEQHAVTFVSVTQAFNTNSSMGRLTLNILLSFAQFERELISERTKDKMAAARKKGRWVGGPPVLGYTVDPATKCLVVHEQEAALVRQIFERYLKERSLLGVTKWLNGISHTTKQHWTRKGRSLGGVPFKITHVQAILKHVLYLGQVSYNGQRYAGQHDPLIGEELFAKVQTMLADNRQIRRLASNTKQFGLLMQRLVCQPCQSAMCHTYTAKGPRRYRYYVCTNAQKRGYAGCPAPSLNALAVEEAVVACLKQLAQDPNRQAETLRLLNERLQAHIAKATEEQHRLQQELRTLQEQRQTLTDGLRAGRLDQRSTAATLKTLGTQLEDRERALSAVRITLTQTQEQRLTQEELQEALIVASPVWDTLLPHAKRRVLERLLERVEYDGKTSRLTLKLSAKGVQVLRDELQGVREGEPPPREPSVTMAFEFPVNLKPVNYRTPTAPNPERTPLLGIRRSLVLGYQLRQCLQADQARNFKQLSQWLGLTHARISQLLSLTLLAPEIQEVILLADKGDRIRMTEQRIRQLVSELEWSIQWRRWQALVRTQEEVLGCPSSRSTLTL